MKVLACTVETNPCPAENMVWIDFSSALDFAAIGISSGSVLKAISFGFGVVLFSWSLGYATGLVKAVIRKM